MSTPMNFILRSADELSPLRAIYSLQENHVSVLTRVLAGPSGAWSVERHEGYDGHLMILLTPRDARSEALVVARTAAGFHLSANTDDDLRKLGSFNSVDELLAFIRAIEAPIEPPTVQPDRTSPPAAA